MSEVRIPGFQLLGELGRGGMGVVYSALQEGLQRPVALKVLPRRDVEPEMVSRFIREVRLCATLSHPNLVKMLDAGETDDWMYLCMEKVEGVTIGHYLFTQGPLPAPRLLKVMEELADALDVVHEKGIVHRDLKPANIMVETDGRTKLMDFGLAKGAQNTVLTADRGIVGSPRYLAPETIVAGTMDSLSDLYGLGICAYEMATGVAPFQGNSLREVLGRIASEPLAPLSRKARGIPEAVEQVVMRLVAKDPKQRYASAADVRQAVRDIRESPEFLGSSWELDSSQRAGLIATESTTAVSPSKGRLTGRSARIGRPSSQRLVAIPPTPPAASSNRLRPGLVGLAIGAVAVIGVAVMVLTREPVLVATPAAPASLSAPAPVADDPRLGLIEQLAGATERLDLKVLVREFVKSAPRRSRVLKGISAPQQAAVLSDARRELLALLSTHAFHGPFQRIAAMGSGAAGKPPGLADADLPRRTRLRLHGALVTLSHVDDLIENFCELEPVYRVETRLEPWVALSTFKGILSEDFKAACDGFGPRARPMKIVENTDQTFLYLFSGLEPVHQMELLSAGIMPTRYTKKEDVPHPVVTLAGPYRRVMFIARTKYLHGLRFLRLDLRPVRSAGPSGSTVAPDDDVTRSIVVRSLQRPVDPEDNQIVAASVSGDLLPPGQYDLRTRAFRLMGSESTGVRIYQMSAIIEP